MTVMRTRDRKGLNVSVYHEGVEARGKGFSQPKKIRIVHTHARTHTRMHTYTHIGLTDIFFLFYCPPL